MGAIECFGGTAFSIPHSHLHLNTSLSPLFLYSYGTLQSSFRNFTGSVYVCSNIWNRSSSSGNYTSRCCERAESSSTRPRPLPSTTSQKPSLPGQPNSTSPLTSHPKVSICSRAALMCITPADVYKHKDTVKR